MNSSELHIGALACSSIAQRQILPVLVDHQLFKLSAVASRSAAKGRVYAQQFETRSCDYEQLLADPTINAVYVSVPTALHSHWGKAVLASGKHLLMEKTMTTDYESTRDLVEEGRQRGLVVMEALAYVFHPIIQQIQKYIAAGNIGRLRHVTANFTMPARPTDDIRLDPDLAGGALLDVAIYPFSFCNNLLGSPPPEMHIVSKRDDGEQVDTRGCIQMAWTSCMAQAIYGYGMVYRNEVALDGNQGRLVAERVFTRPPDKTDGLTFITADNRQEALQVTRANAYGLMLEHFRRRVFNDEPPSVNEGEDLLQRMKSIDILNKAID